MEQLLSQYGGWVALAYIVIRDGVIPIFRMTVPAKIKTDSEQQKHINAREQQKDTAAREDKKYEQALELRQVEALEGIKAFIGVTNERLLHIEADAREIKMDIKGLKSPKSRKTSPK